VRRDYILGYHGAVLGPPGVDLDETRDRVRRDYILGYHGAVLGPPGVDYDVRQQTNRRVLGYQYTYGLLAVVVVI